MSNYFDHLFVIFVLVKEMFPQFSFFIVAYYANSTLKYPSFVNESMY